MDRGPLLLIKATMADFQSQLKELYAFCERYEGSDDVAPLPDGHEKEQLAKEILSSDVPAKIDTELARSLLPDIQDVTRTDPERIHLIARLVITTLCTISAEENYQRLIDSGLSPEEIEKLADEVARGDY